MLFLQTVAILNLALIGFITYRMFVSNKLMKKFYYREQALLGRIYELEETISGLTQNSEKKYERAH